MLVKTGLCGDDLEEKIQFVQDALGAMEREEAELHLFNTRVPLLSVDDLDSEEQIRTVLHTALAINVTQYSQPNVPKESWSDTGNRHFQDLVGQCSMLQLVHRMYQIDIASKDEITQNVSALLTLIHMHIWRCRLIFDGLDVNSDGGLQLVEFEKLWCFTAVSARLAASELLQREAEIMLLAIEIDELEQSLLGSCCCRCVCISCLYPFPAILARFWCCLCF